MRALVLGLVVVVAAMVAANPSAKQSRITKMFHDVGAVPQHSFHPPLLEDFTDSGMHYWSFGGGAVVTNDYVRLTPASGEGHGYLWNQFSSDLRSWKAHFGVAVAQKPHSSLFGTDTCDYCGVGMWAIKEPTRHGDVPFFGIPSSFEGVGVVVHQNGLMHLVGRSKDQAPAQAIEGVSLGRCRLSLSTDRVDITLAYDGQDDTLRLEYNEPGASTKGTICATSQASAMPAKYYLGFTAYGKQSSPVGYDVIGLMTVPGMGAQEKPAGSQELREAAEFDAKIDAVEKQFWQEHGDSDPEEAKNAINDAAKGINEQEPAGPARSTKDAQTGGDGVMPQDADNHQELEDDGAN